MAYRRDKHGNEVCPPLAEDPRYYESNSGNFAQDGYRVLCRRPRVAGFDECLPVEEADNIEDMFGEMGGGVSPGMPMRRYRY